MKRSIALLLASALAFLIAACASTGGGGAAAPAPSGGQVASAGASAAGAPGGEGGLRNFDLRVRCPGVHELKTHGWSDQQIMQQLSLNPGDIASCEQWVAAQPKGYVPPPPPGFVPKPAAAPAQPSSGMGTAPTMQ